MKILLFSIILNPVDFNNHLLLYMVSLLCSFHVNNVVYKERVQPIYLKKIKKEGRRKLTYKARIMAASLRYLDPGILDSHEPHVLPRMLTKIN